MKIFHKQMEVGIRLGCDTFQEIIFEIEILAHLIQLCLRKFVTEICFFSRNHDFGLVYTLDKIHKMPGTTTWNAVRIVQGPTKPQIDITDFTYANREGSSDFDI